MNNNGNYRNNDVISDNIDITCENNDRTSENIGNVKKLHSN